MTADLACVELVALVTEYLDGALDEAARASVERHLTACGGCRAHLEQVRSAIRTTGRLEADDVPADVMDALTRAFRERRRAT